MHSVGSDTAALSIFLQLVTMSHVQARPLSDTASGLSPKPAAPGEYVLSWVIAGAMALAAAVGLFDERLYRDTSRIKAAWLGNDMVTLFAATPLLLVGLLLARRGSLRGRLVWYSMLGYCAYNYAYYLFGARINTLFPIYVGLFIGPIFALIMALVRFDVPAIAAAFAPRTPVRWIAGYMLLTGIGLLVAWLTQWARFVFAGVEPAAGEDMFTLVAALDLSLVVPFFVLGAGLLWRRRPWGFMLAVMMCLKGATYTLMLAVSSVLAAHKGVEGAAGEIAVWTAWSLVSTLATVALLVCLETRPAHGVRQGGG
jgi:hypothetical protein